MEEFEYEDDYNEEEGYKERDKKVRKKLEECEKEKKEYLAGWQRAKADAINLKKKTEEDKKQIIKRANRELILELIPTLESFDMAFGDEEVWQSVSEDWRKGIEYIHSGLSETLASRGVEKISPKAGEEFDPNFHEAIKRVEPESKKDDGMIAELTREGYMLNDEVIKPAKVVVFSN